mmetsp:Transcript_129223/g.306648  ORF Transcript_129223/g.306648 Transcript_129223/m.306648 type:complete len:532 (+) Transcript_129223:28-1623(+)
MWSVTVPRSPPRVPRVPPRVPQLGAALEEDGEEVLALQPASSDERESLAAKPKRPQLSPRFLEAVMAPGANIGINQAGWLQFEPGAHAHIMSQHSAEEMQIILYRGRDLVLYDAHHYRAFARRVTPEQAQILLRNRRHSSCPLCKQALSDSWAFVVEGYWETIRKVFAANATGEEETAAIAQLHSIAAGLLNTGYYSRFFREERKLGSGSFGAVYLCTHMMDEIELGVFAVKKLALGDDANRLRQVVREVKALEKLRHINVIDYKHSWLEIDRHSELCPYVPFLYILMEYCNYGSLDSFIWHRDPGFIRGCPDNAKRARELSDETIWHFFQGTCSGLDHLHSRGILHMDLKPSNIMLHVDEVPGQANALPRPLLSDFGTCEIMGEALSSHGGYAVEFCSPERLENEEIGEKGDMWSAGLILYSMCFGDLPYHSEDPLECRKQVTSHKVLLNPPEKRLAAHDPDFWSVICILTSRAPVARPSARECEVLAAQHLARLAMAPKTSSPSMHPQMLMDSADSVPPIPQLKDGALN